MEEEVQRLCQAVSPNDEPCDYPATVHCRKCGRWFCDAHAQDEEWHPCMLPPGDEGGEDLGQHQFTRSFESIVCCGTTFRSWIRRRTCIWTWKTGY